MDSVDSSSYSSLKYPPASVSRYLPFSRTVSAPSVRDIVDNISALRQLHPERNFIKDGTWSPQISKKLYLFSRRTSCECRNLLLSHSEIFVVMNPFNEKHCVACEPVSYPTLPWSDITFCIYAVSSNHEFGATDRFKQTGRRSSSWSCIIIEVGFQSLQIVDYRTLSCSIQPLA